MIKKLLIANRGEVAMRVLRTAKRLGLGTVAVHSEADARALHVQAADERVSVGAAVPLDDAVKIEHILRAARSTGADAIHPGYGFLSESPELARACRKAGLVFVGPHEEVIAAMGDKLAARRSAIAAGLQVVPGSGALPDVEAAQAEAQRLGYPVLVKANRGGGGAGMSVAREHEELPRVFAAVRSLARESLGDPTVYLEKLLPAAHHVEVQIAGDRQGNVVHLGDRECSVQRRFQKLIEETPSPALTPSLRQSALEAALKLARHVGYDSLGTVEMLLSDGELYFLEVNTRLQVEHGVTELVSGVDLVEWQVHLAMGEGLPATQKEIELEGHAIQCRIYAEDPEEGFTSHSGRISRFAVPTGAWVRNDVGVLEGDYVTPYYDPMIAKLLVHGPDRATAVERMKKALGDYLVEGIPTNLSVHLAVMNHPGFAAGDYDTNLLARLGYAAME